MRSHRRQLRLAAATSPRALPERQHAFWLWYASSHRKWASRGRRPIDLAYARRARECIAHAIATRARCRPLP